MSADWIGYLIGLFGGWFSVNETSEDDDTNEIPIDDIDEEDV